MDSKKAADLFLAQGDQEGYRAAQDFVSRLETPEKKDRLAAGGFGGIVTQVFSLGITVLKMLAPF